MTDTDIFNLWDREIALRRAGKWPEGAPRLCVCMKDQYAGFLESCGDGHVPLIFDIDKEEAALWRIVQFVAWDNHRLAANSVNDRWWPEATPDDWIAEAAAILTRLENS